MSIAELQSMQTMTTPVEAVLPEVIARVRQLQALTGSHPTAPAVVLRYRQGLGAREDRWSLEAGSWEQSSLHELSVAQNIIDIVRQYVPEPQAPHITAVRVRVGSLSGIVAESLAFCFDALVAGTAYRRARLDIEPVAAACDCGDCGAHFEPEHLTFWCPSCGSGRARLASGADLQVVHVELDDDAHARAPS